jgi:hypothetical protein
MNIGRKILDFYCNGYFGREYDLASSKIEGEGYDWLVVRTYEGNVRVATFENPSEKQEMIETWCTENSGEEDED